jgi:hypothetical protein
MRCFSCLCKDYTIVTDFPDEVICYVDKIININNILVSYKLNNMNYNIKLSKIAPIPGKEEVAINALKNFILNTKVTIKNINTTSVDIFRGPISITNWLVDYNYAYNII